jgi:hypothetical protein
VSYTDKELELLISLAKAPVGKAEKKELTSVQSWIAALDIKKGNDRLDIFHLYCEYLKWAGDSAIPRKDFYIQLRESFGFAESNKRKPRSGKRYSPHYMLDATPFDMSIDNKFLRNKRLRELRDERIAKKRDLDVNQDDSED